MQNTFVARATIEESSLFIKTDVREMIATALESVRESRKDLKEYVSRKPLFLYSYEPVPVESDAPQIVQRMKEASDKAGVGPMAAVAGAIADIATEKMLLQGAHVAIVENGGEISARSNAPMNVEIFAGSNPLSGKIGFRIDPHQFPIGIATSSATVSHAFTFGEADAATIIAKDAALADAAATCVCNHVQGSNIRDSIRRALEIANRIDGVIGALIIREEYVGTIGRIPRLVEIKAPLGL